MQQYPPYYQSPVIIISPNQLQGNNYQPAMQQQPVFQVVNPMHILGPGPGAVQCPNCKQNIVTKIEHISGSTTHLWALVACAFICLPCIPYLVNESKDVRHSCTSCGTTLATYLRSGSTVVHAFGNIQQANTQQSPMMQQAQVTQQSPIVQSTQTPLPQPQAPTQQPQLA
ncbi:hypothetical protein FA15DRAFT_592584 [Coprinopsis marcescibilis]|uniref:LITAF domain-containing protein n=1 Tax=Coprinopsis marcescibilis TaxID=230819 RepID=A0A5C3KV63_COPMA|nr:hypothetical protein FA15DRAFT_592584 [Coprinopsis marcescibilis]